MDPRNVTEGPHSASCTGKIALSSQMHQLKRQKKQPVAQQPIAKDAARKKVTVRSDCRGVALRPGPSRFTLGLPHSR
jgi:hypothetical protein